MGAVGLRGALLAYLSERAALAHEAADLFEERGDLRGQHRERVLDDLRHYAAASGELLAMAERAVRVAA